MTTSVTRFFAILAAICLAGCASSTTNTNNWSWHKPNSSEYEFNMDNGQCRAQGFAGTGGMLTLGTIMIIDACMQGKGWYKVNNR